MARSDVQLMLDVKSGDDSSFELLLRKYRTPVVNFLYRMVRDAAAAEDLAQEVFLRVYRARGQYLPTAKFTTWMFRIATNLAFNALRDGRCHQLEVSIDRSAVDRLGDGESEQPALEIADRQPSIELELIRRDRAELIRRAVESLPEKQRAAVLLPKYKGSQPGLGNEVVEHELRVYGKEVGRLFGWQAHDGRAPSVRGASGHLRPVPRACRGIPLGMGRAR